MDIKAILQEKFKEHLSESSLNDITHAFDLAVQEKAQGLNEQFVAEQQAEAATLIENRANELASLQVSAALLRVDEDHSVKLEQLLEAIDKDHCDKLQQLVETVDRDHTTKLENVLRAIDDRHSSMLEQVVSKYETALQEEAVQYKDKLVAEVSNYLELYLDKIVPANQINEAVENIQARRIIDQIRELVSIDERFINSEIKEALVDGKKTIDSLRKELNEVVATNSDLSLKLEGVESALLLENKTKELPEGTKRYVKRLLKGKSVDYIKENYQYVVEMFEKETRLQEDLHKDEVVSQRLVESVIDRPELEYSSINEDIVPSFNTQQASGVTEYLSEMKRMSTRYSSRK